MDQAIGRMETLQYVIEEKRRELDQRIKCRYELEHKQTMNTDAKRKFITRIKLDIKGMIDEINALNAELWDLQERYLPME